MNKPRLLAWDIERVPALGYHWGLFDQTIGINQVVLPGEMVSFAARWYGEPKKSVIFRSTFHDGKEAMLDELWRLHDEADALISWNGAGFDTKHANTEFILAGKTPPSPPAEIDLMRAAKRQFKFLSNKLDWVAQELGVGKKISHEGFGLWKKVMAQDPRAWARFKRYNEMDVHLLIDLYDRMLPWLPQSLNVSLFSGGDGCPRCGRSDSLEKRGFTYTQVSKRQRYRCRECGAWSTSGKRIEGVDIR